MAGLHLDGLGAHPLGHEALEVRIDGAVFRGNGVVAGLGSPCRASTRSADATASGSVVSGFCTEVTLSPAFCNRAITSDQQEPSANSPCTSTTLRAVSGVAFAAMPRVEISEAAAPVSRAVEKVRLFIIMILFVQRKD